MSCPGFVALSFAYGWVHHSWNPMGRWMKFRVNIVYLWLVNQWYTKNNSLRYPPTNVKLYIIGGLPSGSLGSSTSCWIMAHMRKTKNMKKTQSLKKCRLMNFHENMFYFTHKSPRAVWPSKIGTLQGTKRSHLGKRKHVFKHDLDVAMWVSERVN